MAFIRATVAARRLVTPGMVRITLAGPETQSFEDSGVPDEFVRLYFADPETGDLPLPVPDDAGRATFPEGTKEPHSEYYTIRRLDRAAQEIDIDFVVHEGGIASEWAQKAQAGDQLVLSRARFCYEPPAGFGWQVLLADATGLPALGRILDETPAHIRTIAIVEVAEASHRQDLAVGVNTELRWIVGAGNGVGPSALLANFRALTLPAGHGYIWMAGEMHAAREIRRHLRSTLKLTGENFAVVRYWVDNKADWRARWDALDPAVRAELDAIWDTDLSADEKADRWNALLEAQGL